MRQSSAPRRSTAERPFHSSRPVASDNRPSNGPPDNNTPYNERREEPKRQDNASSKAEQEAQTADGEGRGDQCRPGTKRFLRNKRRSDLPKAPRIPDWFLKHNVKLLRDSPGMDMDGERAQVIRCVDGETGHTLFEVPYYDPHPAGLDHNAKTRKSSLQKDFFDSRVKFEEAGQKQEPADLKLVDDWTNNQMRWVFLEAETSARAAFSLPPSNQRSYSIMSNRLDMSLQCPDSMSHEQMDDFVRDLARVVRADVVRLDANDIAELAEDYIDQGHDGPGSYSHLGYDVFQGYEAASLSAKLPLVTPPGRPGERDMDEDEEEEREHEYDDARGTGLPILDALIGGIPGFEKAGPRVFRVGIGAPRTQTRSPAETAFGRPASRGFPESSQDEARLAVLLDSMIDAPKYKHSSGAHADSSRRERRKSGTLKDTDAASSENRDYQRILRHWRANPSLWLPEVARSLLAYLSGACQVNESNKSNFLLKRSSAWKEQQSHNSESQRRTIVHVRELRDIANSRMGEFIIQQLCTVVQKRRRLGEHVLVVGTTAQDSIGPVPLPGDNSHIRDFPLRSITVPPFFKLSMKEMQELQDNSPWLDTRNLENPAYRRILEINTRHLQSMLRKLRPEDSIDLSVEAYDQLNLPGMHFLTERVLPAEQVQRLVLIAIGLAQTHARSERVEPIHVALAGFVAARSDHAVKAWASFNRMEQMRPANGELVKDSGAESVKQPASEARLNQIKKSCNPHETRLLPGVVDPTNIKTTFSEVHVQPETINALKDLTTLALLRPQSFKYGVLASDRLPGLLLYGPPGTGKTLLAKAVAKESAATVLEVSGAQVYEKYVGEGEKMVRAVFSLAKKLSPCVVFIDEADAIFGSRSGSANRNTQREILNQFLREWDGMDDHGVFIMVASNRPFDLDDAVLRRLPRRLLVDLPVAKERESILGIHLRNEVLDHSISLSKLAEQTPLYSGSDLKNLSVAAALACVREENELASQHKDDPEFKLPETRTLLSRHFDKALAEISASISEDMSSLAAIRKFDEQYGDRRGRRKKTGYGFGLQDGGVDESAVRVRSGTPPPPPS